MKTAPSQFRRTSLAVKLGLMVLAGTSVVFAAAFLYNHALSRRSILSNAETNARHLAGATVSRIEAVLNGVENIPCYMALCLEQRDWERADLIAFIRNALVADPDIFGSAVAFEPYAFNPQSLYFAPYCCRQGADIRQTWLGSDQYQYFNLDWYILPKELNRPMWSEPYFDEGGGKVIMTTYSVPFYRMVNGRRQFQGIVTADIALDWLVKIVSAVSFLKTGYACLISQNGMFVTHPDKRLIMRQSIFDLAEGAADAHLRQVGQAMVRGDTGFVRLQSPTLGKPSWLYYAPLKSPGWSLGVLFPEDELFADAQRMGRNILLIGLVGFVILFLIIVLISAAVTRPIRALARTTAEIALGNLDIKLPLVKSRDEVGELSYAFDNMRVALKEYIAGLTEATVARERLESELKIARTIQMSFLPKHFPPFPEQAEFDLYARLEPAKQVGGDLYDFFLLDDQHLFFSIGDVADKGVPAALFMAVTKTLMKGIALQGGLDPAGIMEHVNQELCKENDTNMFVTVFCGVLNFCTGKLVYSNAGHNPPLIRRAGSQPEELPVPKGIVLGTIEAVRYSTASLILHAGDTLVLYTDGVTEACNPSQDLYSMERLRETAAGVSDQEPKTVVDAIFQSVNAYAAGAPQSDDITVLALHYHGESSSDR
ncbi:MAG: SpoIIE family protein phosphatase [Kiritimatiellae bacterium]|nr:SpoIIE family protein phosphatase [Kiritimatiellia bacterium]